MTVLVYGWVALDEIVTPFARIEGELGGSATPAVLAASLFTDVRLLAAIGEDFPPAERAKLEGRGIDLAGLTTIPGGVTSTWGARYGYDMNARETLYTGLGVNADWTPALPAGWEDSSTVLLGAAHPSLQRGLQTQLPAAKLTMIDTIKLFIEEFGDDLRGVLGGVDIVTMNDGEARQLMGTPSIARASRQLLELGSRAVVVKLGEYGALLRTTGRYVVVPGYPLEEIVDPTGAGDAFAGAFLGYLDHCGTPSIDAMCVALDYASVVASFQVEGLGPSRLLTLTREEVETRYAEFRRFMRT